MTALERLSVGVLTACGGLLGMAIALGPDAAAAPLTTGGGACVQTAAGQVGGGAPMAGCALASAPLADMAGVPLALPGPVPVVPAGAPALPVAPGLPAAPIVPAPAAAAPLADGAPLLEMAGGFAGKGDPVTGPAPGAPVAGRPTLPGPALTSAR